MHREHFAARMPDVEDFNLPNGDFSVTEPTQGNNALVVKVVPRTQRLIVSGELEDDEHAPDSGFFFEFGRDDSVRLRFFPQIPSHVRENQRIISQPNVAFPSPAPAPSGPPSLQREQRIDLDSIFSGTPKHNRKNDVRVKSRRKGPIEL